MRNRAALLSLAVAGIFAGVPAFAETMNFTAALDAKSENPPNASPGTGQVKASYDTATKKLSWTVTYSGLTGAATAAHFHGPAPVGKNAGVMVPIKEPLASPIEGSATLTEDQAKALADGQMYFNIHTPANKGGEIRGQVDKAM